MNSKTQPKIQLEVTVPRILLPTVDQQPESEQKSTSNEETVRILPIETQSQSQVQQSPEGQVSTYAIQRGNFRLFRLNNLSIQGKAILLQILRQWQRSHLSQQSIEQDSDPFWVTDELTCTIEYHHSTSQNSSSHLELIPGHNRVAIVLDEDGIPISYSIDGAEN